MSWGLLKECSILMSWAIILALARKQLKINFMLEIFQFQLCQATDQAVVFPAFVQGAVTDLTLLGITERIEAGVETALPGCSDSRVEKFSWNDTRSGQQGARAIPHQSYLQATIARGDNQIFK